MPRAAPSNHALTMMITKKIVGCGASLGGAGHDADRRDRRRWNVWVPGTMPRPFAVTRVVRIQAMKSFPAAVGDVCRGEMPARMKPFISIRASS